MKEQLISFETAKLAKEKGFDWETIYYYDFIGDKCSDKTKVNWNTSKETLYSAPTQSLLQKWLREKHNIHIVIHTHYDNFNEFSGWECIKAHHLITGVTNWSRMFFKLYEETLEAGLSEALKLI